MSYQPAENLTNRTFVGLIIAQFLAGFNDQAIHAVAMFYAIHTKILSEANAITLMPILFFAPWAIFCTLAGYFADRFSKTMTLRIWKISEIVISIVMIVGFILGAHAETVKLGGWLVMSCVFMMGTHAAFFAPAKYGAMPEILRSHILSRGNGILESTTFLASILGTVSGGLLFNIFRNNEIWIGVILLTLSVIGAVASFMIAWLPASCPDRLFPKNLFKPLVENLKILFRSRPLALAVLGIAFFVFMVAFMRQTMYMHGETRNPRWDELTTSLIVATVALGVGLGAPFAGYLSGGKVELGLVPLGCLGMIFALLISAMAIEHTAVLVVALIIIGFFSGFYMVPLYTLLQQRAPKKSKGELVATSNFINVTGAIAASLLFNVLVQLSRFTGMTPEIPITDQVAVGVLEKVKWDHHGKLTKVTIKKEDGSLVKFQARSVQDLQDIDPLHGLIEDLGLVFKLEPAEQLVDFDDNFFDVLSGTPQQGDEVIVSSYMIRNVQHYLIRMADQPLRKVYDNEILPRYLFLGAGLMTLGILLLLWRKLPDFFVRSLFWFKSIGRYRIKAVGLQNLPMEGPVILAANCEDLYGCLQLVSATDRSTKVILVEDQSAMRGGALLRWMALRHSLVTVRPNPDGSISWMEARVEAERTLQDGHLLAINIEDEKHASAIAAFLQDVRETAHAPILPVYCGSLDDGGVPGIAPRIRVVFGEMMTAAVVAAEPAAVAAGPSIAPAIAESAGMPAVITLDECRREIQRLGEWIREHDNSAGLDGH